MHLLFLTEKFNFKLSMRHSGLLILTMLGIQLGILLACSSKNPTEPRIVFNDTICHLAMNRDNPRDSFDFVYSNAGDKKLVIYSVAPSCDCVTAKFEQKELAKGESSYIRIYFDATNVNEENFWRTIDVYTNAQKDPYTLDIEGTIE